MVRKVPQVQVDNDGVRVTRRTLARGESTGLHRHQHDYVVVPLVDAYASGQPELVARFTLGMFQAAEQGFFAGVDPLLRELLGREPQTVREMLAGSTTDTMGASS